MIIDFTRNFTDEEFKSYQELFDLWWRLYEEFREAVYELEDQPYDPLIDYESPGITEPTEWMDLIGSGMLYDKCPGKEDEVLRLEDICKRTTNLIEQYKEAGYVYELYWPDDYNTKTRIMKLLNKRESKFVFIFHPHPRARDILLIKGHDDYKEVKLVFDFKPVTELEFKWLVDYRGWQGTRRVDNYNNLTLWLCENCSGNWKFSYTQYGSITHIYFEMEEDLVLYRLRFVASDG